MVMRLPNGNGGIWKDQPYMPRDAPTISHVWNGTSAVDMLCDLDVEKSGVCYVIFDRTLSVLIDFKKMPLQIICLGTVV